MTIVLLMILGAYGHSLMASPCPGASGDIPQDNTLTFKNTGTGSMTITSIYFTGSPITIAAGATNTLTCRGGGSPTEFFYSGGTAVQVTSAANGGTYYTATLSGGFITIPAQVLEENYWGTESPSKNYTASCSTPFTYKLGAGAYQDIVLPADTYFDFTWNPTAGTTANGISGYKATIQAGGTGSSGITSFLFNTMSGWYSGSTATTIRVLAKRTNGSWDCNRYATFTITTSQPISPSGGTKSPNIATICAGTSVSLSSTTAGTRGFGCSDDYIWLKNGVSQGAYTLGSGVGSGAVSGDVITIQGHRGSCTAGCTASAYTTLATWSVVAQPTSPSGGTKSPNLANICAGTSVSFSGPTAGAGGDGCSDDYIWLINGVSQGAYTLGNSVGSGATAGQTITIQGRRGNCTAGAGCTASAYTTLATWSVVAQPASPSGGTKSPNLTNTCAGTNVSLSSTTAGSGGTGCTDDYIWLINGSSQGAYTLGSGVGSGAVSGDVITIQGRRANCTAGAGCTSSSYTTLATWTVNPQPTGPSGGTKSPNVVTTCTGTGVSFSSPTAGTGGFGCSDDYIWLINATPQGAYTLGSTVGTGVAAGNTINIQGRRNNCTAGAGCSGTSYTTLASWAVVAQPTSPTGGTKSPNLTNICTGTDVSLSSPTAGTGGDGCSDDYIWLINGSSQGAYTLGSNVGSGAVAGDVITIQGRRANCTSGAGCTSSSYSTLATWTVNAQPTGPSGGTKSPNLTNTCQGTNVSLASTTAGTGGFGCTDDYRWLIDGTPQGAYTLGSSVGSGATAGQVITIEGRRSGCTAGAGCTGTSYTTLATWTVNPQPTGPSGGTKSPNVSNICTGTTVSLSGTTPGADGFGCSDDYIWLINGSSQGAYTLGSSVGGSATAGQVITIQGRRNNCTSGSGCTGTSYTTLATWTVNAQPVSGTLTKTPNTSSVCEGNNVSATATAGSGGAGTIVDELDYRTDDGTGFTAWTAYTSGTNIPTTGLVTIEIRTYRTSSISGCNTSSTNTVSWTVSPQPVSGTLTKSPNTSNACEGTSVSATLTAGSGGAGTVTDVLEYRFNGTGGWSAYTSGSSLSTTGKTLVEIRTYRTATSANCVTGSTNTVSWIVDVAPVATPTSQIYTCDGTASLLATGVSGGTTISWQYVSGPVNPTDTSTSNPLLITFSSAGTGVYNLLGSNTGCTNINLGSVSVVMPTTLSSTIASSAGCAYCVVTNGNTKVFYDNGGKLIARIDDDGASPYDLDQLDSTEVCVGIDGSVLTVTDNLGNNQPYLQRKWTIKPKTNTNSTVTLYFTATELAALAFKASQAPGYYTFSGLTGLQVSKYSGGCSTCSPAFTAPCTGGIPGCGQVTAQFIPAVFSSFGVTGDYQVQFTINSFSTFYIAPALYPFAPLPVELLSFTGWNQGVVNKLQWITASEQNTSKFVIEKNIGTGVWNTIGERTAAGNSNQQLTYDFADNDPTVGDNYYRLRVIDNDGIFSLSNVINIPISEAVVNNFSRVYPNPTGGQLNVEIQSTGAYDAKVLVYDVIGKKVYEKPSALVKGLNTLQFDFSQLAKGTYVLQFSDKDGKLHSTKFVKE